MTSLGTTGTQHFFGAESNAYRTALETLDALPRYDIYISGACIGWDYAFGVRMFHKYQGAQHVIIVPSNWAKVAPWWQQYVGLGYPNITVIQMPADSTYKQRNQEIVDHSDDFFFCAQYPEKHPKSKRSGTWQTVRLAERKPIANLDGVILSEVPPTE